MWYGGLGRNNYRDAQMVVCDNSIELFSAQSTHKEIMEAFPYGYQSPDWSATAARLAAMVRYYIRFEGVIL